MTTIAEDQVEQLSELVKDFIKDEEGLHLVFEDGSVLFFGVTENDERLTVKAGVWEIQDARH